MDGHQSPGHKLYKIWRGDLPDRWWSENATARQRWEELADKTSSSRVGFTDSRPGLKTPDPLEYISDLTNIRISGKEKPVVPGEYTPEGERKAEQPANAITEEQHQANKDAVESGKGYHPGGLITGYSVKAEDPIAAAEKALLDKFVTRALRDDRTRAAVLRAIIAGFDGLTDIDEPDWALYR